MGKSTINAGIRSIADVEKYQRVFQGLCIARKFHPPPNGSNSGGLWDLAWAQYRDNLCGGAFVAMDGQLRVEKKL